MFLIPFDALKGSFCYLLNLDLRDAHLVSPVQRETFY